MNVEQLIKELEELVKEGKGDFEVVTLYEDEAGDDVMGFLHDTTVTDAVFLEFEI